MSVRANISRINEKNKQLEDENAKLRTIALQNEDKRNRSVEEEVQRRLKSATQELEKEVMDLRAQLAGKDKHTQDVEAEVQDLRTQLARARDDTDIDMQLREELSLTNRERDDLRRKLEIAERNLDQRNDDHCKVEKLERIVAQQCDEIERQGKRVLALEGHLRTKDRQLKDLSDRLLKVISEKDKSQADLNKANHEKDRLQAALSDAISHTQNAAKQSAASLDQARTDLDKEKHKRKQLKDQIKDLTKEIEELKARKRKSFWTR